MTLRVGCDVSESARGACALRPDVGGQCDERRLIGVYQQRFTGDYCCIETAAGRTCRVASQWVV